ncbi:helix-turn-helix domain-containing protein [Chondrinema litorale]|uniref:helix-turn-helix domain-containing protein n=1 Tax=Chondrinema litorale TaxID=2994555 RepID=UPI002543AE9A|nr:helix-turn-helix domain-containing protein [Chondrinema litorale]UZR96860.1 helix-turn-helix domain-containing protein [Chondrinema litorale]
MRSRNANTQKLMRQGFTGEKMMVVPRELIKKYLANNVVNNLYLTDIGYFPKALNHFRNRPNGSLEYILIYCIEGQGIIKTKNQKFELTPNSFYIISPQEKHTYQSSGSMPWSIYWVHFTGKTVSYLYQKFSDLNNGNPVPISNPQSKTTEFDHILDLFSLGYRDEVFEYSSMLLHKLIGSFLYDSLISPNTIQNDDTVKRIVEFMNEHIYDTLTIKDIEKHFGKSSSTLFTIFKNKTGHSIMQFFSLIKIQKACELINLTSMSIKEISYKLDYQDPLYFSRVFKKFMGVPPTKYKRENNS